MPGWPSDESCKYFQNIHVDADDATLFKAIANSINIYYNFEHPEKCNVIYGDTSSNFDTSGWNILACADLPLVMETNGVTDMFVP